MIISYANPSLTTYKGHNPSYRVFFLDKRSYNIINYISSRLDLFLSNQMRTPIWYLSFDFQKSFGVSDASVESHMNLIKLMQSNDTLYQLFVTLFCSDFENDFSASLRSKKELIAFCLFANDNSHTMTKCLEKNRYCDEEIFINIGHILNENGDIFNMIKIIFNKLLKKIISFT